jgi:hypothetical protein
LSDELEGESELQRRGHIDAAEAGSTGRTRAFAEEVPVRSSGFSRPRRAVLEG